MKFQSELNEAGQVEVNSTIGLWKNEGVRFPLSTAGGFFVAHRKHALYLNDTLFFQSISNTPVRVAKNFVKRAEYEVNELR
jgi:hypothetical protein